MRRFNGIKRTNCYWFLKECEWRFNGGYHLQLLTQLKVWYTHTSHYPLATTAPSLNYTNPKKHDKQIIESISQACIFLADNLGAKIISTITHSGSTARRVAKFRPKVPIFALSARPLII
jgi:hypothetical protein